MWPWVLKALLGKEGAGDGCPACSASFLTPVLHPDVHPVACSLLLPPVSASHVFLITLFIVWNVFHFSLLV